MNASDDRKREQFEERINGATAQARTINQQGGVGRPNCLIIDEIDGAPSVCFFWFVLAPTRSSQNSIDFLVQLARDALPTKKKERRVLCRPIICICNDLYAPALRQLRQLALILHMRAPDAQLMASRLAQVYSIILHLRTRSYRSASANTSTCNNVRSKHSATRHRMTFVRALIFCNSPRRIATEVTHRGLLLRRLAYSWLVSLPSRTFSGHQAKYRPKRYHRVTLQHLSTDFHRASASGQ